MASRVSVCVVYRVVSCSLHTFCWLFYTCISQMVLLTSDSLISTARVVVSTKTFADHCLSFGPDKTRLLADLINFCPVGPPDFAMTGIMYVKVD